MTWLPLDEGAGFVNRKALRAKRHRLIEPHALADDGGLTDDDTGPMIDKEAAADLCAGMNVDARLGMRKLGNDACDDRCTERMQRMRNAVMNDRFDARKACLLYTSPSPRD